MRKILLISQIVLFGAILISPSFAEENEMMDDREQPSRRPAYRQDQEEQGQGRNDYRREDSDRDNQGGKSDEGMKQGAKQKMMGMGGGPSMVATSDGGLVVLAGSKLTKYDKDLNVVKELDVKPAGAQKHTPEDGSNAEQTPERRINPTDNYDKRGKYNIEDDVQVVQRAAEKLDAAQASLPE